MRATLDVPSPCAPSEAMLIRDEMALPRAAAATLPPCGAGSPASGVETIWALSKWLRADLTVLELKVMSFWLTLPASSEVESEGWLGAAAEAVLRSNERTTTT